MSAKLKMLGVNRIQQTEKFEIYLYFYPFYSIHTRTRKYAIFCRNFPESLLLSKSILTLVKIIHWIMKYTYSENYALCA